MTLACVTSADGTDAGGHLHLANAGKAPRVTVSASIPYNRSSHGFGFDWPDLTLQASEQAAVMGI